MGGGGDATVTGGGGDAMVTGGGGEETGGGGENTGGGGAETGGGGEAVAYERYESTRGKRLLSAQIDDIYIFMCPCVCIPGSVKGAGA